MENTCEFLKLITNSECFLYTYVVNLKWLIIVLYLNSLNLSIRSSQSEEASTAIQVSAWSYKF